MSVREGQAYVSMALVLAIALVVSLASPRSAAAEAEVAAERERPNVLFIVIDDLNDWVGVLGGHPQVQTPNIDRLAARGTLFSNAHVQSPLCNSSRVSALTGLRPTTTGVYNLSPHFRDVERLADVVTLPQHFAENGYHTLSAGKVIHTQRNHREGEPLQFHAWGPPGGIGARPEHKLVEPPVHMGNHPLLDWGVHPEDGDDSVRGDHRVATWAEQQLAELGEDRDQPFFLAVGFFLPHVPLYATQQWFDLYPEDEVELPTIREDDRDDVPDFAWHLHWYLPEPRLSWLKQHDQWRPKVRAYLATISFVDAQVGRVLDALEAAGLEDQTIVVLWSDHGYHLGEKGITGKNTLWEESTRVPLIFAGPDVPAGGRSPRPVEILDLYPTLVQLAGLPEVDHLEGASLVPLLKDPHAPRSRPAITTHNPGNHSVRSQRWRYIRYADGSEELYDHDNDPHEFTNLAGRSQYANVIADHARHLPRTEQPHAPGSEHRRLEQIDGVWHWEGEAIDFDQLIR